MAKRISLPDLPHIDAKRIGIIKPSALGDIVQTLPILPALRHRFPEATVSWVIAHGLRNLLEGHPDLERTISFHRRGNWRSQLELLGEIRRAHFDLVLDLQGLIRTGIMTWASRAPLRLGMETAREGAHRACHLTLPGTARDVSAQVRYQNVATALGCDATKLAPKIAITADDRDWIENALVRATSPRLVIAPGAKWMTKRWPAERFAHVAANAVRQWDLSIVVVGSPDEVELASQVETSLQRFVASTEVVNLAGKTSLRQLAGVLESATVVLANDSGPMHLAAAMGTPVVAAFTCTDPVQSGPPGTQHALVATRVPCAGSYRKKCPHSGADHLACFNELETQRVWQAVQMVVERELSSSQAA
ncbi:glycosyltransferase family 9 protein [Thalassoroseus pseudoceratinae]|uniref:glycosyltransferase family 9 protein n=1 Tax=Thalassoroseus pseudoceratinae TaxID=2713176 RepID=UPI00141FF313|nr:glycosyltransferase family 9 protein [Thalassoroseus pseudoceratinae]